MFSFDAATALKDIQALQQSLQRVENGRLTIARKTAQFAVSTVRDRIQLRGENAEGETMISSSPRRLGNYSESYGKIRQKEGLRTDIVNLTFTGELMNSDSWAVIDQDLDEFGAGFRSADMSQRAEYIEDQFGPVFQLSASEEADSADYFQREIDDLMTATF